MSRIIDPAITSAATHAQQQAADPQNSVWVSANAGTGKTTVLVNRLLRLMIAEPAAAPEEILGLTYSKAGARQMLDKLTAKLALLAGLADAALAAEVERILLRPPVEAELLRARQLYNRVLDTPPTLATIHSFCAQVLARFPLEAGVPPQFVLWEEQESAAQMQRALSQTLLALADPAHPAHGAYQHVMATLAERNIQQVLYGLLGQRARLQRLLARAGGVEGYLAELAAELGVDVHLAEAPLQENTAAYVPDARTQTLLVEAVPVLLAGGKTVQKRGQKLQTWLALAPTAQVQQAETYVAVFFNKDGSPPANLTEKSIREQHPEVDALLLAEQERLQALQQVWAAQQTFVHTAALLRVTDAFLAQYTNLKRQHGALDFEDLIQQTAHLLNRSELKDWIRYRLDRTLKHVLLDEGQDTNFRQWEILKQLVAEFFSGEGSHTEPRTLFAVGDVKQSIYRFQEAQPEVFQNILQQMHAWDNGQNRVQAVALDTSFRSAPTILQAVDQIFGGEATALTGGMGAVAHRSPYPAAAGMVNLWPLVQTEAKEQENTPWVLPGYAAAKESGPAQLARQVAQTAYELANGGDVLACTGRRIDYGDMMILLRSRAMLPALVAACHSRGVPVVVGGSGTSGAEDPLVADLLALCRVLVNPADDLALAQLLKSPVLNQPETLLADLAAGREKGQPLLTVLAQGNAALANRIRAWQMEAGVMPVYALLVRILQETQARGAFVARFGGRSGSASARQAVQGVVDAFLDAALAHGSGGWHAFIQQVTENGLAVTTGSGGHRDAVQILTAHGAKGLEAPIVFLPDTTQRYTDKLSREKWLWEGEQWLLYALSGPQTTPLQERLRTAEAERMVQDEQRLLYVAMTRAEERLYIGGVLKGRAKDVPEQSWYKALQTVADKANGWLQQGDGSWLLSGGQGPQDAAEHAVTEPPLALLPAWAGQPVTGGLPVAAPSQMEEQSAAQQRGEDLHRLLEVLPGISAESWPTVMAGLLPAWPMAEQTAALAWVRQVVAAYPWLFGPESRAEVSLQDGTGLGRIDRMVVTADQVRVIDFKTVAQLPTEMPAAYIRQVNRYAAAATEIFPEKTVQAGILWLAYPGTEHRLDLVDLAG